MLFKNVIKIMQTQLVCKTQDVFKADFLRNQIKYVKSVAGLLSIPVALC